MNFYMHTQKKSWWIFVYSLWEVLMKNRDSCLSLGKASKSEVEKNSLEELSFCLCDFAPEHCLSDHFSMKERKLFKMFSICLTLSTVPFVDSPHRAFIFCDFSQRTLTRLTQSRWKQALTFIFHLHPSIPIQFCFPTLYNILLCLCPEPSWDHVRKNKGLDIIWEMITIKVYLGEM